MKIALIHHWYPSIGGTEKYVTSLAHEFNKQGHKVFILTSKPKTNSSDPSVLHINSRKFFGYIVPQKKAVVNTITQLQPDIIHVQSPHPYATVFAHYSRKAHPTNSKNKHIPVISTYHAPVNPSGFLKKFLAIIEQRLYKQLFSKIIVTTQKTLDAVSKFYPPKNTTIIPLGIDNVFFKNTDTCTSARQKLNLDPYKKYVLFVGQMDTSHYYKGIPELLKCAAQSPEINYLLIGDGNQKSKYQQTATDLKAYNINFLGNVSQQKLPLYYKAANLFTLPSNSSSEGYGMVLLEALACGTPVITTSCAGSSREITENHAGEVISSCSPDELLRAIKKKLVEPMEISNLKIFLKTKKWDNIAKQNINIYSQITAA